MPRDFNFPSVPLPDGTQEWAIFKGRKGESWMLASNSSETLHVHFDSPPSNELNKVWRASGEDWEVRADLVDTIELLGVTLRADDFELTFCQHHTRATWPRDTCRRVPKVAGTLYTFEKMSVEISPSWKDIDAQKGISHFAKVSAGELGQPLLALAIILEFSTYPKAIVHGPGFI